MDFEDQQRVEDQLKDQQRVEDQLKDQLEDQRKDQQRVEDQQRHTLVLRDQRRRRQLAARTRRVVVTVVLLLLVDHRSNGPSGLRSVYDEAVAGEIFTAKVRLRDGTLRNWTRFNKQQFSALLDLVHLKDGREISRAQKVVIFLTVVCQGHSFRAIQQIFHHSLDTISSIFHEVLDECVRLHHVLVYQRVGDEHGLNLAGRRYWRSFEGCVGALDGSHVSAWIIGEQAPWRNRKGFLSQNVLAVVNFEGLFTYVLAGWEGTAHDGRVLGDALLKGFKPLVEGQYWLADAGYSNTAITMVPYRGVRYHLREIRDAAMRPRNAKELFNYRHSSMRNVVERAFGVLKGRFKILRISPVGFTLATQRDIVYACTALHNLLGYVPLNRLVGEDMEDPDNAFDGSARGERQDRADTTGMAHKRESVTEKMWLDYSEYCLISGT